MTKRKIGKYVGIVCALTVICTLAFWGLFSSNVFGKFVPAEPYVTGEPESLSGTIVTSEGSNLKGEVGTGALPCSEEVPTAEGKKGSETNPFVILEIVPDHAQQQMTYLAAEDYSEEPLDIMKWGIEIANTQNKSYVPGSSAYMSYDNLQTMGQWFCNWQYEVYKIGSEDREVCTFANIGQIYTVEFTTDDLEELGIDPEQFQTDYNDSKEQMFADSNRINLSKLLNKNDAYEALFEEDADGKEIRKIALNNKENWKPSYENKLVKEAVTEWSKKGSGYLVAVAPGQGDFSLTSFESVNWGSEFVWALTRTGTDADRWMYVEDASQIPAGYEAAITPYGFWNNATGLGWVGSIEELYTTYKTSDAITGIYMNLSEYGNVSCRYDSEPEQREETYTFEYYGVYNKNILKRQLFTFADQQDYDDFHMQVVTMTPSELNTLAEKDTDETLDMIERADMFYIGCFSDNTGNISNVYDLYYKFMKGQDSYDVSNINTFIEDDLEWELCYKILYRLCLNKNLPIIMTQGLGNLVEAGTADIPMYETSTYKNVSRRATLNNIAKLYLIGIQFDLTAKKSEDESFVQTFYDDILMEGKLNQISLSDQSISTGSKLNSAKKTGYYVRPKLAEGVELEEAEKCYYLWNMLTFFPADMEYVFYNGDQIELNDEIIADFVAHGYMRSYFQSTGSTNNKLFTEGGQTIRQNGSDGTIGNVAIPHQNGDSLYSTLLGNTESVSVLNTVMDVAYQIMNNRPFVLNKQIVSVLNEKKQYVRMSDTSVLLDFAQGQDYSGYREYESDQPLYLKISVHTNGNSQPGLVTKVTLVNEDGDKAPEHGDLKLYSVKNKWAINATGETRDDFLCETVTYNDNNGSTTGYNVDGTLVAYVPFSLQMWAQGYNIIEIKTVARSYDVKNKKYMKGNVETDNIVIGQRVLSNLS